MKAKRSMMKFSMSRGSGTIQAKFRLLAFVCFSLIVSTLCTGCFEETQVLVLNKDGSGHYESVIRFNSQMSVFIEMAEKVAAIKGLPPADSPFGMVLPNLESYIRAKVERIEGVRLLHLEMTRFGEQNEQRQVSFALDFDDINAFLASPLGIEDLGLRLSKDAEGNFHLKETPSPLVAIPPAGGGMPSLGMIISQMKSQFGIAGDPEFDALFHRLLSNPKSTLTFVAPTPIKQTNGTLVQGNKVEWKVDIIDAASASGGNLYEVVLEGAGLEFDVRETPRPTPTIPSSEPSQPSPSVAKPFDGKATVQPMGVQIGTTLPDPSDAQGWNRIRPFWGPGDGEGTIASLLVTIPSGGIVRVDDHASTLIRFTDDTGKNLLADMGSRLGPNGMLGQEHQGVRGVNHEYAQFFVGAPGKPANGATSLSIAGSISVVRGSRLETYEQSDLALDKEQTFTLGGLSYRWRPPGDWNTQGWMEFRGSAEAHDAVLRTQFFTETGAEIRTYGGGSGSSSSNNRITEKNTSLTVEFPRGAKTVKMVVTSVTDHELLTIPFEVTLGLNGAGQPAEVSDISVQSLPDVPTPPPPPGMPPATLVGQSAPEFTLTDLEGKSVSLSDFKGKVVLLDFWATWCPPCVKEIPHFIELYEQYKGQGFEMVGISADKDGINVVKSFVEQHGVNYPILMGNQGVAQLYSGISSIPTTFLIDKEGRIQRQYVGYRDKSVFEEDIKTLLSSKPILQESQLIRQTFTHRGIFFNPVDVLEFGELESSFDELVFVDEFDQPILRSNWAWIDPNDDCTKDLSVKPGWLRISAPEGNDLWPPGDMDGPRLLVEISGDFAVETRVGIGNKRFAGGLLIWADENNYIRFERGIHEWARVGLDANIEGQFMGLGGWSLRSESVYLRIERKDKEFAVFLSADGKKWVIGGTLTPPANNPLFRDTVQVGLDAIGSSTTYYDYFKVLK